MYLKSIEIRGFKSFADKTEINLKDGITTIVGPNGSGKSNISDAVRWVLGEQSIKSLRGGKMEDVIFAGTQFRKPVGLAEVSLIIDNSERDLPIDYLQVTISRKLFRSGESEYNINNTKCRLRDVQELFMDTGVGKEGYSIIGQGKIGTLLSGGSEERRELLEEAAGIVKFKTRKLESIRKLENTDQNLIRINDILQTYEERLPYLEGENQKANSFLGLSNELKETEVNLTIRNINEIKGRLDESKQVLEKIDSEISSIDIEKEEKKSAVQDFKLIIEEFEETISEDNKNYYKKCSELQELKSESLLIEEKINNINSFLQNEEIACTSLENEIIDFTKIKTKIEVESIDYKEKNHILIEKIQKQQDGIEEVLKESMEKETFLIGLKRAIKTLDEESIRINNRTIQLNSSVEVMISKRNGFKVELLNYKDNLILNDLKLKEFKLDIDNIKLKKEELEATRENNKNALNIFQKNHHIKEKEVKELGFSLNNLENKNNILNSLEKHYEGYSRAVKNMMVDIDNNKILGFSGEANLLGEAIESEKKYETAIEISLGSAISNVVVKNDEVAKKLVSYLKTNHMGRATFLPLENLRVNKLDISEKIKGLKGYLGIASELVSYNKKYEKAIIFALGRTIIADNIDNALIISKASNYSYRIVTLDGELLNLGGSITGGSSSNKNVNILGRKREIQELKLLIASSKESLIISEDELVKLKNSIKDTEEAIVRLTESIHNVKLDIMRLQEKKSFYEKENGRLSANISTIENEYSSLDKKFEENREELKNFKVEIEEILINKNTLELKINEGDLYLKASSNKTSEFKDRLTELKIEKAKLEEIVENNNKDLIRVTGDIENRNIKLKDSLDTIENQKNNIKDLEINVKENLIKEKTKEAEIKNLQEVTKEINIKREEVKLSLVNVSKSLDDLEIVYEKRNQLKHKVDIATTKYGADFENSMNKLNEEYKLTYAEALKYSKPIDDIEGAKSRIRYLKNEINSLGTVNLGAIDEYKEVKEKFTFLDLQKNDLTEAKDDLVKVINEMTSKMKEVFIENFEKLRINFNETFKELFKGGNADLIISGADVLTSPIEINVQPPGKKLQNINLLSGGEKGLSAIALLFAILKMKPSPFCILDEIEAALDDVNVMRFAEFLKKFSKNTQFVVITHRKGTMECSDVLYGVTMEEKGVSKIVSVDLKN